MEEWWNDPNPIVNSYWLINFGVMSPHTVDPSDK